MKYDDYEQGPIRPPSEAESILIRTTRNCTWNKCKFCTLYKGEIFSVRTVEEIKIDIDIMAETGYYNHCNSAFLQDANSIVLSIEKTEEILLYLKMKFPGINRVTTYGRADTLAKITIEEYKKLFAAGLNRIHSGYESGSDIVLKLINKGNTKAQEIEAGKRIKESGIQFSVYFMPGVGGKEYSEENYKETGDVINQINPDFVRIRTFVPKEDSGLQSDIDTGIFTECTDIEKAMEIKRLIKTINNCDGEIISDHIINLFETVKGNLKNDKEKLIDIFDEFEALSLLDQQKFQIARRMGLVRSIKDLSNLSAAKNKQVLELMEYSNKCGFEFLLKELLRRY
ncbi:MAG: radical SAM protein, partial [Peptostreptococcaceae bacterium]|nr:radical SAM protein [Peptostreptococcaceae bacterium]